MKFLADECLYFSTIKLLKNHYYEVVTIKEKGFLGIKNGEVIDLAKKEHCILLTRDMHFCSILKFPPKEHNGIIVLKINPANALKVHDNLLNYLKKYPEKKIKHTLVVIDHNKVRIRR
ncbi:MAG: DUF5615 family PIN-like protein [Candidatus Kuenenia sp.]|nr:DUF5615 family PIN-like protein [Candidatus Kuenenia sp.]